MSDAASRRLVFVRHGQTHDNAAGIWQGHRDSALSEVGLAQAHRAAPEVAAYRPQLVVSSDLQRARVTAQAIGGAAGLPVRVDARLREIDVGEWQGRTSAEVRAEGSAELEALGRGQDVRRGRTGETVAETAVRVLAALREVIDELEPARVAVVVGHGVSSRAGAAALAGLDQMQAMQVLWGLENCHWAVLAETGLIGGAVVPTRWRLDAWNLGADPIS
ncbi:MAG: histidine phosphatase family protein [Actinomycetota bacterium]|nr:histidine phosphatase family protein [Actinomycetota bacterium]